MDEVIAATETVEHIMEIAYENEDNIKILQNEPSDYQIVNSKKTIEVIAKNLEKLCGGVNQTITSAVDDNSTYNIDNVSPFSPAKAILSAEQREKTYKDDGFDIVLTTLEPAKKLEPQLMEVAEGVYKITPIAIAELQTEEEEGADEIKSVQFTAEDHAIEQVATVIPSEQEVARLQLEALNHFGPGPGRPKKNHKRMENQSTILDNIQIKLEREVLPDTEQVARKNVELVTLIRPVLDNKKSSDEAPKINDVQSNDFETLQQPIILNKDYIAGTIEIPKELISGNDDAINVNIFPNTSVSSIQHDELLAILEGSDVHDNEQHTKLKSSAEKLSKQLERELAIKQMLNLPLKKKGRKTATSMGASTSEPKTKVVKRVDGRPVSELVSSLVDDWSDNDSKHEEMEVCDEKASKIIPKPQPEILNKFKRSRIIKKKIIWDPDAPETSFSYASLVSANPKKKIAAKMNDAMEAIKSEVKISDVESDDSDQQLMSQFKGIKKETIVPRKKKISELDKLMGDEGALTMLNALKNEIVISETETNKYSNLPTKRLTRMIPQNPVEQETNPVRCRSVVRSLTGESLTEPPKLQKSRSSSKAEINQPSTSSGRTKNQPFFKKDARNKKPKSAAQSWDYIYSQRNEDALIIRRRSNSSYSSTTSPIRLSIDMIHNADAVLQPSALQKSREKGFQFAKPNAKKLASVQSRTDHSIVTDLQENSDISQKKSCNMNMAIENEGSARRSTRSVVPEKRSSSDTSIYEDEMISADNREIKIIKHPKNIVEIVLTPRNHGKVKNTFTIQLMKELVQIIKKKNSDQTCKVVLLTSTNESSFCDGLDFSALSHQTTNEKKIKAATDLSTAFINLIKTLLQFKKPIIAGVQGRIVGIGVTLLSVIDLVYATKKTTLEIPAGRIGYIPEGCHILSLSRRLNSTLINRMVYLGETIHSIEAQQFGLITHILDADKFKTEIFLQTEKVAVLSSQSLEATKNMLKSNFVTSPIDQIQFFVEEQNLLIKQWTSTECQEKFKKMLSKDKW